MEDSSFLCYATSPDGIHWTKPSLGHIEYRKATDNNIVLRHMGSHLDSPSVFHHPGETYPYKMLIFQATWPYKKELIEAKGYDFAIDEEGHYPFQSKDGIHWEPMQETLEWAWRFDRSNAAYDTRRDLYIGLWKQGYRGVRSRKYAESEDLLNWTDARWLLIPQWKKNPESRVDPPGTHFYGHYIFNYGAVYMGLLEILNNNDGRMYLQLMSSRDLVHWNRMSAPEAFINYGEKDKDEWDWGIAAMGGSAPVLYDDCLWFYYGGSSHGHEFDRLTFGGAIGLARLPMDRFASVEPVGDAGTLTTVPLKLKGDTLFLNADTSDDGGVRVEVLDLVGDSIPGLTLDECETVKGDVLDAQVRWKCHRNLGSVRGPVRLRFHLVEGKLYSFRVR